MPHPPLAPHHIDAPHRRWEAGDFALESGATIRGFAVSYVTHGRLAADRGNAVLVLSAIGANHHRLDFLIGPSKALDPARDFIVAVDAIGNGLTTSPSTSAAQPGLRFPRFAIRDMVESQRRLLRDHLGIERLRAVCGASMGGMQALQWAVSHPDLVDAVIALTPMARTTPWAAAVNETARRCLLADPAWTGQGFAARPERGWRAWAGVMRVLAARTPQALAADLAGAPDLPAWMAALDRDTGQGGFDALDWLYQSWAYDAHDVGATRGCSGVAAALARISARTLVMAPPLDLYNPVEEARACAATIPGARFVGIPSVQGHQAANVASPADVAFLNAVIGEFLMAP